MTRLYKLGILGGALFWLALAGLHAEVAVTLATDLQDDARNARSRELPILLAFSAIDCSYCEELEEEFLEPMLLSGEYREKILIRKLILDNGSRVTDFSGNRVDATELADRYRVFVTPTLLFVDTRGQELAERMVGINTLELFGGYLDECIETALLKLRAPEKLADLPGCRLVSPRP
jgi:thioredoxin-related protein